MQFNFDSYIEKNGEKLIIKDIEKFESWRGYKLPKDFVEFTLKYPFAHMSAEFDADGRPDSMISNMLKFSKEGYSSIYIDEAYDIKNFGPYVLFGEDPGGNYIAFDYSKNELNPSVVFIDHEELGVIELPEGTTEDDFTEVEIDNMMNSGKLIDFPWAIHYIADSFIEFMNILKYEDNKKYEATSNTLNLKKFELFIENSEYDFSEKYINFMKKYGGMSISNGEFQYQDIKFRINFIFNFNVADSLDYDNYINEMGGQSRFKNIIPFAIGCNNFDVFDTSLLALIVVNRKQDIVVIPDNVLFDTKNDINPSDLIFVTNEIDKFFESMAKFLEE
ncbi:hypothetical protein GTN31_07120 [Macrococcoides canis]|uniref:SMI1/KNR4 family protein n=1 Tax=Macrococcoides canis TaxID=1855823 RepID=UPI0013E969D2|nr:SMI1/KNR4 family protein [Macrococcus canis]QIH76129.1 hypothetical protein GTN31_07120 [Macrococcus canis]